MTESTYSTLIGAFVNDAKREVEDSWDWTALRSEVTVTCVSGTTQYALAGTNERTRILQALNDTRDHPMYPVNSNWYQRVTKLGITQNAQPVYYRPRGWNSVKALLVDLYPTPNAADLLLFECVIPQAELTVGTTEVTVPAWPVIQYAYAQAISERGEDGGVSFDEAMVLYQHRLGRAIGNDTLNTVEELTWMVV
ncbi:MAG: hypothetical protein ACRD98_00225 [Nitrososphaera sp.]